MPYSDVTDEVSQLFRSELKLEAICRANRVEFKSEAVRRMVLVGFQQRRVDAGHTVRGRYMSG